MPETEREREVIRLLTSIRLGGGGRGSSFSTSTSSSAVGGGGGGGGSSGDGHLGTDIVPGLLGSGGAGPPLLGPEL